MHEEWRAGIRFGRVCGPRGRAGRGEQMGWGGLVGVGGECEVLREGGGRLGQLKGVELRNLEMSDLDVAVEGSRSDGLLRREGDDG